MKRIKIPFVVTQEERARIKAAYLDAVDSANAEKVQYINEKLPKVLRRLRTADDAWLVQMSATAERFAFLLRKDSGVSQAARKELVAALYYLCDPFEVIPDYVPGRGYADDALVLNTCLSRLRQKGISLDVPSRNLQSSNDSETARE